MHSQLASNFNGNWKHILQEGGPGFLLEIYHLINFSFGGNKKGTKVFYRRVSEPHRDLMLDKRIFSVSTLG